MQEDCTCPDVAYDPSDGTYIVVWTQSPLSDVPSFLPAQRIMAIRVDGNGRPVGDPVQVSGPGKDQPLSYGLPAAAVAAGINNRSIVVWEEQTVVLAGGTPLLALSCILASIDAWDCLRGDLDGDNNVDLVDLAILAENWLAGGV